MKYNLWRIADAKQESVRGFLSPRKVREITKFHLKCFLNRYIWCDIRYISLTRSMSGCVAPQSITMEHLLDRVALCNEARLNQLGQSAKLWKSWVPPCCFFRASFRQCCANIYIYIYVASCSMSCNAGLIVLHLCTCMCYATLVFPELNPRMCCTCAEATRVN